MASQETTYDLLILGGGPTAFAAALRAKELGKTAVMVEDRMLGGTCVNRGCLPSKNLIEAARLVFDAAHPRYPGLTPARLALDFPALVAQKDDIIRDYREQHYAGILDASDGAGGNPIQIVEGRAVLVDQHMVEVTSSGGHVRLLSGDQVLIATGSLPFLPDIPGLADVPYLTSDLLTSQEDLELTELPPSLMIIGGGYIALELGQMFSRLGSQVTILERSERILKGEEPEISLALMDILLDEGVRIVTDAHIRQVSGDANRIILVADVGNKPRHFTAAKLLVAAGRSPNTVGIGLDQARVHLNEQGSVQVDSYLRTNITHIWAAGDVIGSGIESQMATPIGAYDGGIAASNALGGALRQADHSVIPRAVFTDPEVAIVGITDEEATARGIECQCQAIPISAVPRAGATRYTPGVIKMVIERATHRVLGVSMVGTNAHEVIHEAAMGLRFRATIDDFIDMIHVYPSMAEALKIVSISFSKDYTKLSCCAT